MQGNQIHEKYVKSKIQPNEWLIAWLPEKDDNADKDNVDLTIIWMYE